MSPREIQRTMDFILRSQANAVIRMDKWEEEFTEKFDGLTEQLDRLHIEVRETSREVRALVRENRAHEKRIRALEKSERQRNGRYAGLKEIMTILTKLMAVHSKRLDQLERRSG